MTQIATIDLSRNCTKNCNGYIYSDYFYIFIRMYQTVLFYLIKNKLQNLNLIE